MYKKIFLSLIISFFVVSTLFAKTVQKRQLKKEKILIFNLHFSDNAKVNPNDAKKRVNYEYYGFIIPHTLTKNLRKKRTFTIQRIESELQISVPDTDKRYIKELKRMGRNYQCSYIITGKYSIVNKKLVIDLLVVDLRGGKISRIQDKSNETGAVLKRAIDTLSREINLRLKTYHTENKKRILDSHSPFSSMYRALSGLSFGVNGGRYFIIGSWKGSVKDGYYINPYIAYDISRYVGINLKADYFATNNKEKFVSTYSFMTIWGISGGPYGTIPFLKYFRFIMSPSLGMSLSKIRTINDTSDIFSQNTRSTNSKDLYLDIAALFRFQFRPLQVNIGAAYKRIFYKGDDMDIMTVFIGAAYHL